MRALLIFDHGIDSKRLKERISALDAEGLSLFPLTSQWHSIRNIEQICQAAKETAKVELIESAKLIDNEVDILRQRIFEWSFKFGEYRIGGRSIKEWFLLPQGEVSTWWFSLLSEKNTERTDVFLKIAQLGAIDKALASGRFELCLFSTASVKFSLALQGLLNRYSVAALEIKQAPVKERLRERLKSRLEGKSVSASIIRALPYIGESIFRAVKARLVMGPVKNRLQGLDYSVLFISYFPYLDKEWAEKGILKNRYAVFLQDKLAQLKKKIVWVWMYVSLDKHSFSDALKLASGFAKRGEPNFFLEEFLSPGLLFKAVYRWLRQVLILIRLKSRIADSLFYENLCPAEAGALLRGLMLESFAGRVGLEGILYFEKYKKLFSYFQQACHCVYLAEMFAWEKALNAAKRLKAPAVTLVAFQHTFVSKNCFPYFCCAEELKQKDGPCSFPLPDILACNGDITSELLSGCGYPNLKKVEAVRQLHLASNLGQPSVLHKERILLVAGSVEKIENKALLALLQEAFPKPEGYFKIWIKGHPSLPLESILKEAGINPESCGYIIKDEPISELLKPARAVMAGVTSVALEALACGCSLILPVFADSMFLSPMVGFHGLGVKVYSPGQLREAVYKIMENPAGTEGHREGMDFVSRYWCLDKSLQRWEAIFA